MFAGVQSQTVVDLSPHPSGMVSPFEYDVGDAPRGQLLRDCEPAWPSSHDGDIETLSRQFLQTASRHSHASSRGP